MLGFSGSARVGDGPYHTFVIYDDRLVASFFGGYALWEDAARSFITKIAERCRAAMKSGH